MATSLEAAAVLSRWLGEEHDGGREGTDAPAGSGPGVTAPAAVAPPGTDVSARSDPNVIVVPVLPEGANPADPPPAIETLAIDRRLFPPLAGEPRVVGYRLSAHGARRVADALQPGDCAVVALGSDPPPLDALCAVRIGSRIEIARVRLQDGFVHLPGPASASDSGAPDERIAAEPAAVLVGRVVVAFRRWL